MESCCVVPSDTIVGVGDWYADAEVLCTHKIEQLISTYAFGHGFDDRQVLFNGKGGLGDVP